MEPNSRTSKVESLKVNDLTHGFLSLKIGEIIARLQIREIRKITNPSKEDNLSSVNYKYIIESTDGKLLMVNSWSLWKKISSALREASSIQVALRLEHSGINDYSAELID